MADDTNRFVKIFIDNQDALTKTKQLNKAVDDYTEKVKELTEAYGKEHNETEKMQKKLDNATRKRNIHNESVKQTIKTLDNLSGATKNELLSAQAKIRTSMNEMVRGTEEWNDALKVNKRLQKEITKVNAEMRGEIGANGTLFSRAANGFNKYFGMLTAGIAAITGVSFAMKKMINDATEWDKVYRGVADAGEITVDEVKKINQEIKKIDTTTSRQDLNALAETGLRLGESTDEITGYVAAVDKVNVVMGKSFGNVEEMATTLGKVRSQFQETKDMKAEDAYTKIASSLNILDKKGAGSAKNIAEFTMNLGSMQDTLKPTIADSMALGTVLEESGQSADKASRSYAIVINTAAKNLDKFARFMGISKKELEDLINTRPVEFLKQFSTQLKSLSGTESAVMLKKLGIGANEAQKFIGALSNKTERLTELQEFSNEAFREGTNINESFAIKNEGTAATLEKAKKRVADLREELGNKLMPAYAQLHLSTAKTLSFLIELPKWLKENRGLIIALASAWTTYFIALNAAKKAIMETTEKVTILDKVLNFLIKTIKNNPFGFLLAVITAIGVAVYKFATHLSDSEKAIIKFNQRLHESQFEANGLFNALKNTNEKSDERKRLIDAINTAYGKYLPNLLTEKSSLKDIETAQLAVNKALREKIAIQVRDKAMADVVQKYKGELSSAVADLQKEINKRVGEQAGSIIMEQVQNEFIKSGNNFKKGFKDANSILKANKILTYDAYNALFDYSVVLSKIAVKQESIEKTFTGLIGKKLPEIGGVDNNTPTENTFQKPSSPLGDEPDSKAQKAAYEKQLALIKKWSSDKIEEQRKYREQNEIDENEYQMRLSAIAVQAQEKMLTALKKIYGENSKQYQQAREELLKKQDDFNKNLKKAELHCQKEILKAAQQQHKASEDALKESKEGELRILEKQLKKNEISQTTYNDKILEINKKYALLRLGIEQVYFDAVKVLQEQGFEGADDILFETQRKIDQFTKDYNNAVEDAADGTKGIIGELQEYFNGLSFDGFAGGLMSSISNAFAEIDKLRQKDKASWLDYAQGALSITSGMLNSIADLTKSISEMETAQLEAEYAKQLGDLTQKYNDKVITQEEYNEQKADLEYQQKVDELEIQKKHADVNLGVQLAQIAATTALGIAGAWGQGIAQLGPIAGAIAAGVATAALLTTAGIETASAISERNRIKSMTIEKPGGNPSSASGAKIVSEQAAEGRYNVIGAEDGKTYNNVPLDTSNRSGVFTNPTLVAEEPELVVSTKHFKKLSKHINYPVVLEAINDARFNRVPQRAKGDYTAVDATAAITDKKEENSELLQKVYANIDKNNTLLDKLLKTPLRAYTVLNQFNVKQELDDESVRRGAI